MELGSSLPPSICKIENFKNIVCNGVGHVIGKGLFCFLCLFFLFSVFCLCSVFSVRFVCLLCLFCLFCLFCPFCLLCLFCQFCWCCLFSLRFYLFCLFCLLLKRHEKTHIAHPYNCSYLKNGKKLTAIETPICLTPSSWRC